MSPSVLVDSNVVVYAYDQAAGRKQQQALFVLRQLVRSGHGHLSTQVLGEFFRVATRKLHRPLTAEDAYDQVSLLASTWPVLSVTPLISIEAARGARDHRLPFWDAQLWATARLNQVALVFSEDFADGHLIDGVRFRNPFAAAFDLTQALA